METCQIRIGCTFYTFMFIYIYIATPISISIRIYIYICISTSILGRPYPTCRNHPKGATHPDQPNPKMAPYFPLSLPCRPAIGGQGWQSHRPKGCSPVWGSNDALSMWVSHQAGHTTHSSPPKSSIAKKVKCTTGHRSHPFQPPALPPRWGVGKGWPCKRVRISLLLLDSEWDSSGH